MNKPNSSSVLCKHLLFHAVLGDLVEFAAVVEDVVLLRASNVLIVL